MTKLTRILYTSFAAAILLFLVLALIQYKRMDLLDESMKRLDHTNQVMLKLDELNVLLLKNGTEVRNSLITDNGNAWEQIAKENRLILRKIDTLQKLSMEDPVQNQRLTDMKKIMAARWELLQDSMPLIAFKRGTTEMLALLQMLNVYLQQYQTAFSDVRNAELRKLAIRMESRNTYERYTRPVLTMLLLFAGAVMLVSSLYLIRNLRKRMLLQQELQAKIETLNIANRELENLSRVASHHIQEPMRKIRNFSTLLYERLEQLPPEEARVLIKKVEDNAAGLQTLAHDLVQYANLIQDRRPKESTDLNEVLDEVLNKLEDKIYEKGAEIKKSRLPSVYGVPYQLFILLHELVSNSLHFTREGEKPYVEVVEWHSATPDTILLVVRDHGQGFSNEYAERIFRIFEQLDPRSSPGRGIGLAMCARIMLNHGGKIWAEGNPGKGASFFIEFPHSTGA